ncbi:hypothetical protein FBU31_003817 [Coemansia sp. 'formosensis']|nr:hypothetical protein FBU31_003817 [Coemansia sp. 'formosensis']
MDITEQQRAAQNANTNTSTETSPSEPIFNDADDDDIIDENTRALHDALARAVADALAPLSLESKKRLADMNKVRGHLCSSCNSIVSEAEFAFHTSRCNKARSSTLF